MNINKPFELKLTRMTRRAELRIHDTVAIRNCPPISARKRFTLDRVLKSPETEHDALLARLADERNQGGVMATLS